MRDAFYTLADRLVAGRRADEEMLLWLEAERSGFVRFNRGRVRQPGTVDQAVLSIELLRGARHSGGRLTLAGDPAQDRARLDAFVGELRAALPSLPEDPHLLYNTEPASSESIARAALPEPEAMSEQVCEACAGLDFVGMLAAGEVYRGFASSLGQRNWFAKPSFNLGFSLYSRADKAVKSAYAGLDWDAAELRRRIEAAAGQIELVSRAPKTIAPGCYRVYLAPAALEEIVGLLSWNAFGLKSHRTRQTPLLRMLSGTRLAPQIRLCENTAEGAGPAFGPSGFVKPAEVELLREGALCGALVSPRSAREYDVPTNGAGESESAEALDLDGGALARKDVLADLDTGICVNNLWYLNYSDRAACRITGMTRFATFWVEGGVIRAPLNVMRFDATLYDMLGANLIGLTRERELRLDESTYGQRSTASMRLPGALVDRLAFTL